MESDRKNLASQMAARYIRKTFLPDVEEHFGVVLLDARFSLYRRPKLITAVDGVGTKLKLAFISGNHDTVGYDLLAMVFNDILRRGTKPIGFLSYLATSQIDLVVADRLYDTMVQGCQLIGCSYLGGETAEMSGFYNPGEYDMAGFAFGVVENGKEITGVRIVEGDVLLGIPSTGLHSNGFTLAREVLLPKYALDVQLPELEGKPLIDVLLEPTKIYTSILALVEQVEVHGIAHITGGGLTGKIGRILPEGFCAVIHRGRWESQAIFKLIQREGDISVDEMFRTFNMGFGMVVILPRSEVQRAMDVLVAEGEAPIEVGTIRAGSEKVVYID